MSPVAVPAGEALVQVRGVSHRFKRRGEPVLRDVSLDVLSGETLGLVGESGSGKTTLARAILGTQRVAEGTIVRPPAAPGALAPVAMVFQDVRGSMDPRYTIARVIGEASTRPSARERREHARELLELVALDPAFVDRYPHQLSGGQRQRVALARALATGAGLLVLDEPTSALDAHVRLQTVELLERVREERGLTLLIVSHDFQVVERLCTRVAVMLDGELLESGPIAEVLRAPRHEYTATLLRATKMASDGPRSRRRTERAAARAAAGE